MDPGEAFLTNLITWQHEEVGTGQNDDDRDNDPVNDNASLFSSTSLDDIAGRDILGNLDGCPGDVSGTTALNRDRENDPEHGDLPILLDRFAPLPQNPTTEQINAAPSISPPPSPKQTMVSPKTPTGPIYQRGDQSFTQGLPCNQNT